MIYQAIITKYIGPTNIRGSRIKATADAGSITLSYDDALNSQANHNRAARALVVKFGWVGNWRCGRMPNNKGNCYVCSDDEDTVEFNILQGDL